jgi:hypothetical protein
MAVEYIGGNAPDGMCLGLATSEKLSFYGTTPAARQSLTVTTVATTVSVSTTSAIWGFSTSSQANQIIVAVDEILKLLATVGLGG